MSVEENALSSTVDRIAALAINAMIQTIHFMSILFHDYFPCGISY